MNYIYHTSIDCNDRQFIYFYLLFHFLETSYRINEKIKLLSLFIIRTFYFKNKATLPLVFFTKFFHFISTFSVSILSFQLLIFYKYFSI